MKNYLVIALLSVITCISSAQVLVSVPDTSARAGDTIAVPVKVSDLSGLGVLAFQFSVAFNELVVSPLGIDEAGDVADTAGWTVLSNNLPGELRVGGFGSGELARAGVLLHLRFRMIGTVGSQTSITLNPFVLNSGTPEVQVSNGSLAVSSITSTTSPVDLPNRLTLEQNYPNPFNPTTSIRFFLPQRGYAALVVFNTLGQMMKTIVAGELEPGLHQVQFDAEGLSSGTYFYRLTTEHSVLTRKLVLVR